MGWGVYYNSITNAIKQKQHTQHRYLVQLAHTQATSAGASRSGCCASLGRQRRWNPREHWSQMTMVASTPPLSSAEPHSTHGTSMLWSKQKGNAREDHKTQTHTTHLRLADPLLQHLHVVCFKHGRDSTSHTQMRVIQAHTNTPLTRTAASAAARPPQCGAVLPPAAPASA